MPTRPTRQRNDAALNAIQLLANDHQEVDELFRQYETLAQSQADDETRRSLAEQICSMLTVHAAIEEEIFYPAAADVIDETELLNEAEVEHASAKELIARIQASDPSDVLYDAQVQVLGEYVRHHVEEEEGELFPECRRTGMDLYGIVMPMATRRAELMRADEGAGRDDRAATASADPLASI